MIKTSELIWQDAQHQVLFELIDELKSEPFDPGIVDQLRSYAVQHFALEEIYMTQLEYPGKAEHIAAHDKFRAELNQMAGAPDNLDSTLRNSLSLFLREWLKRHVLGIDKKFEAFVMSSDAK